MDFASFFNAVKPAYEIEHSLRFDGSSHLSLAATGSGGSSNFTMSVWVKLTKNTGTNGCIFGASSYNSNAQGVFLGDANSELSVAYNWGINATGQISNNKFRDPSAWYHLVMKVDSTDLTLYVNDQEVSLRQDQSYSANSFNSSSIPRLIGAVATNSPTDKFKGYLAEFHFVDGSALDPDNFGEEDSNGVWIPKKYTGSHGSNGFYLKFDPDATNGIGHDHSGNGNHFTANGFFTEIGTPDYNANWIGSTSGSIYSGSWDNVFDGDASTSASYVYAYNNTATCTFSTSLSGEIEVLASNGSSSSGSGTMKVLLSDGSEYDVGAVTRPSATFYSFGTKSNITSITITSSGGGNHGTLLFAIRVDGNLLVNNSAKAGYDNFSDTPTKNFCTWNAVAKGPAGTYPYQVLSNGNLQHQYKRSGMGDWFAEASFALAGTENYYWEVRVVAASSLFCLIGICEQDWTWNSSPTVRYISSDGKISNHVSDPQNNANYTGATYGNGDVIGCAWNGGNQTLQFYKNGVAQGSPLSPTVTTGKTFVPCWHAASDNWEVVLNCGQRDFEYTPPTGYKTLSTDNLPAPTVKDGSKYFDTVLWTGNQTARTISLNSTFTPDFIWIKNRTSGYNHSLQDVVRGFGASTKLASNVTTKENSANTEPQAGYVDSVAAGSFDIDASATATWYHNNLNSNNYVAWNWLAGGSGSSNTDGSITSTVSANPSAGFSIVTYTGTGSGQTVGHGLGVAPAFIITKSRDNSFDWGVLHHKAGTPGNSALLLNTTASLQTNIAYWNNTAPTSTTFSIGSTGATGGNNNDYVAYCFSEVENYSRFGEYTGNGSADGPFVYCGFKPAWVLIKRTGGADDWFMYDTARDEYNQAYRALDANTADVEKTSATIPIDVLSNGFKIRSSGTAMNGNGETIIFAAFSENPFGGDGVSPATAR